jgi:O-antigen/teichoic acid export membrane protein
MTPGKSFIGGVLDRLRGEGLAAQLVRGAAGTGGLGIASKFLSLLAAIVLSRSLGSEGYGHYAFAIAAVAFIAVPAQLGLPRMVMREVAAMHARADWGLLKGLRRRAVQIAATTSVLGAVVLGGGLLLAGDRIAALDPHVFSIALLLLPLQVGIFLLGNILCGLRLVVRGTWPTSVFQPALFVLLVYLMASGMTAERAVALNVLATLIGLVVSAWLLGRCWPAEAKAATPEYRTREWIDGMLPFALIAGLGLLNQKTDIVMLGLLTSAENVGAYNIAYQGALLVSFPLIACNAVLAPNVARLHAQGDHARLQRLLTSATLVVSLAAAAAVLVLVVAGRWLIDGLFGEEFAAAYPALVILAVGQLVNAWAGSVGMFLSMTGHEKDTLKGLAAAALLNLVLNILLIPPFGMVGAAGATALSMVMWNIVLAVLLNRRLGLVAGPFGRWLSIG